MSLQFAASFTIFFTASALNDEYAIFFILDDAQNIQKKELLPWFCRRSGNNKIYNAMKSFLN